MTDLSVIRALFVEDRYATRIAMKGFMTQYPFSIDFAEDYDNFKDEKFPKFNPNVVIVDYDLKAGKYHKEIFDIVKKSSDKNKMFIGLIGVTAISPFEPIVKEFKSAKYHAVFFDDGTEDYFLNIIGQFSKFSNRIIREQRKKI